MFLSAGSLVLLASSLFAQVHKDVFTATGDLARQLEQGIASRSASIAVLDIVDPRGKSTSLSKLLSEELTTNLIRGKKQRIVERRLLHKVLEELNMQSTDLFDPEKRKEFGRFVKADVVAIGTYLSLSNSIKINVGLVDIVTGDILTIADAFVEKTKEVRSLADEHEPPPPPPPPALAPRSKAGDVVFKEDFSRYSIGDFASEWGPHLTVLKTYDGRKALSTQAPGLHTASKKIEFPTNFALEIEFIGRNLRGWHVDEGTTPVLVDKKGNELKIHLHGDAPTFQLPGTAYTDANPWNTEGTFKLTKKGTIYKVYWREQFIVSGNYADYGQFVLLRFRVRQNDFIGKILITDLGD